MFLNLFLIVYCTLHLDFAVLPQGKAKWCELEANAGRDVKQNGEHVSV